jgi:hypothetical protein
VHPGAGARIGHEVEAGFLRRLFAGAHQPGRPRAHADQRDQGGVGRYAGDAGEGGGLYERIVSRACIAAFSIKAAEACKVIENTQRDLNIALMNELAIIFDKVGIDTSEVLEAAGTKWNFLKFSPAWWAATASASIRTT